MTVPSSAGSAGAAGGDRGERGDPAPRCGRRWRSGAAGRAPGPPASAARASRRSRRAPTRRRTPARSCGADRRRPRPTTTPAANAASGRDQQGGEPRPDDPSPAAWRERRRGETGARGGWGSTSCWTILTGYGRGRANAERLRYARQSRDGRRLDHRGPRAAAGALRVGAGLRVGRARLRRPGARGVDRDAHRPARAERGRALAVGARPSGCWARCSSARRSPACSRRSAARSARALRALPGFGAADGVLGAVLIAGAGLGVVWILGALAVQSGTYRIRTEVQRSVDPAAPQHRAAPVGPAAELAAPARPVPADRRARGARGAAAGRDHARSGGPGGRRQRGEDPRHGVRAGRRRVGLGRGATGSSSRTPTSWRGRTTRACCPAAASRAGPRRPSTSTRATTSRSCASTGSTEPPLDAGRRPRAEHVGGDPRLPAQRAVRRARRAGSA